VRPLSPHWAGYVDTTATASFSEVQATWVQPLVRCDRPGSSVAFWIGLGGATARADGLEQIGTTADCSGDLLPSYSAWYELIPAPAVPVELPITVEPGDTLSATISARDRTITLAIRDVTTGDAFSATQSAVRHLDLSSAEWIAEAPSFCIIHCVPLPLANFGTVTFKDAVASASGHTGTIDDAAWSAAPIKLTTARDAPSAAASHLSADGGSFSVRWRDTRRRRHAR
jgi:Peptidase A4 family